MASTGGARYVFFANGENVNTVITADGNNLPQPIAGDFNLEVVLSLGGSTVTPLGYQGVALMSKDGRTLNMATGDYGVRDTATGGGAGDTIIAGTGNDTIDGGKLTNMIIAGSGADVIAAAASGSTTILGGSGTATIQGGGHDSIAGGSGPATIVGAKGDTIGGGGGALSIDGSAGRVQITAGTGNNTIAAANHDTVTGSSGNSTIDLGGGPVTLNLGAGIENIVDTGSKSSATITGFNQVAGDRISFKGETAAAIDQVVAAAKSTGDHTVITLPDGTTMNLIGITQISSAFFK